MRTDAAPTDAPKRVIRRLNTVTLTVSVLPAHRKWVEKQSLKERRSMSSLLQSVLDDAAKTRVA